MKILGVILAAGLSNRFKSNKLIFNYNHKPILQWTIDLLNNFDFDKIIVVNDSWEQIKKHFFYNNYKIIKNPDYKSGISSSVKVAINYALNHNYDTVLIFLGDMPLIPQKIINDILNIQSKKFIVAPYYNGKKGFPTLIKRQLFNDILNLEGDAGIKQIIKKHPEYVEKVETNFPEVTVDFDYKSQLRGD
ncbi:nucleotidyltransferase family protein [Marinitoga arctica]